MPLNFTEDEKSREPVEFFVVNTKARPQDLEGEVLPELIRRCGDVKSGRISVEMVEAYLDTHVLIFDRAMVKSLFSEADFKGEGSLDARALKAALSARYPKRQLHREWRELAALLLGVPELVLADDIKNPKVFDGTFNKESVWDSPAPELPKAPPHRRRKPRVKQDKGDWAGTTQALQASGALSTTSTSAAGGTLRTAEGLKSTAMSGAQSTINSLGLGEGKAVSTFSATAEFERHQRGLELTAAFSTMSKAAAAATSQSLPPLTAESIMSGGTQSIKAWSAALPPTSINVPSTALKTLRSAVKSTIATKPEFLTTHAPLTCAETDLKKTLGQPLDVALALNRVEPVRDTKVLPQADFIQWGDYASRGCRTAPTNWYNEHPAAPAPPQEYNAPWC